MDTVRLTVRPGEEPLAPGSQQIALGVEHRDRVLAAIESVDPILPIDADRSAVTQGDFFRRLRPILVDLEAPLPASELNRHAPLPPHHFRLDVIIATPRGADTVRLEDLLRQMTTFGWFRSRRINPSQAAARRGGRLRPVI